MYKAGHTGVSLVLFAPILAVLLYIHQPVLAFYGLAVVIFTAPLPDIDLKPPFRYFVGHRTWTHSLWFAIIIGLLSMTVSSFFAVAIETPPVYTLLFGFVIGVLGILFHLAGDMLTHSGIRPLYPFGPSYAFHLTSAKGLWWFENVKSGNQNNLSHWESFRHRILNSNRVFFVLGLLATGFAFIPYVLTV
jgi:inner membrane protein